MKESYARQIIADFPYPVAKQFVKLRTDECIDPGPLRLKYILLTAEALARFMGMVVMCECRELLESGQGAVPRSLSSEFGRQFKRPAWGFWMMVAREGLKMLDAGKSALVLEELPDFFLGAGAKGAGGAAALAQLNTTRNGLSHDKISAMLPGEFETLCDATYGQLCASLESASFLLDYPLSFCSQIEVTRSRKRAPVYTHRFKKIVGTSDDFFGDRTRLHDALESPAVLLRSEEKGRSLVLDPLLVYETPPGESPDVYFYCGMSQPEAAEYAGCGRRGTFELGKSPRAGELAQELQLFLDLFSGPAREP